MVLHYAWRLCMRVRASVLVCVCFGGVVCLKTLDTPFALWFKGRWGNALRPPESILTNVHILQTVWTSAGAYIVKMGIMGVFLQLPCALHFLKELPSTRRTKGIKKSGRILMQSNSTNSTQHISGDLIWWLILVTNEHWFLNLFRSRNDFLDWPWHKS